MEDSKKHFFSLLFLSFSSFRVTFRYICVFLLVSALFFNSLNFWFSSSKDFQRFYKLLFCCCAARFYFGTNENKKLWENSKKQSREKRGENLLSLSTFFYYSHFCALKVVMIC